MNEEAENAVVEAAKDWQHRNRSPELPTVVLPDWMWAEMPEGYAEDFKRRTGITLTHYD